MRFILSLSFWCFAMLSVQAQPIVERPSIPVRISGRVVDSVTGEGLAGVNVLVLSLRDSTRSWGGSTGLQGGFEVNLPRQGGYRLRITYIGYRTWQRMVRLTGDTALGSLRLVPSLTELGEVEIQETARRVEQRGDTTEINASSYRTAPDADAEQLIRKMPGITVENGQLKAQGEEVKRVLLDGQEYFGNDATAALRNLPAEVIEKVQLIDRQSDQAQFTGINDGNTEKTLNLITRTGLNNSRFGKIYSGVGEFTGSEAQRSEQAFDNLVLKDGTASDFWTPTNGRRWMGGGNATYFKGKRRLSAALLLNNINQQNFSGAELSGLLGGGSNLGGSAMGGMRGGGRGMPDPGSSLLNPSQRGLTTTLSSALNYSDQWAGTWKLNSSLLLTRTVNEQNSASLRTWFSIPGLSQSDSSRQIQDNLQSRWTARLEWNPDSNRSMIWTPRFSYAARLGQLASVVSIDSGYTDGNQPGTWLSRKLSQNVLTNRTENLLPQGGFEWLYRQRLAKARRNFSVNWALDFQDQNAPRDQVSEIFEAGQGPVMPPVWWNRRDTSQQFFDQDRGFLRNRWDLNFVEPLGAEGLLEWTASPLWQQSRSGQRMDPRDSSRVMGLYNQLTRQNLGGAQYGLRYRWGNERREFSVGLQRQDYRSTLSVEEVFTGIMPSNIRWNAWLPNASWRFNPTRFQQYRVFYRASTQTPSVQQLQPILDNTNPLSLSVGNPFLDQAIMHTVGGRFRWSDGAGGRSVFVFVNGTRTQGVVGNENLVVPNDTALMSRWWSDWKGPQTWGLAWQDLGLTRGAQITRPANLGDQTNLRWYSTYAHPWTWLKANMNWTLTSGHLDQPVRNNGKDSRVTTQNLGLQWGLSSSRSEKWDYNVSLNLGWNRYRNLNNAFKGPWLLYQTHAANARIQYTWRKRWVLGSDYAWTYWGGLDQGFNASIHLLNLSVATKVLPNKLGEWRLSVFDLLGQNRSVSRTLTELYVDDNRNTALGRFVMLTFTYNFRNFGKPSRELPTENRVPMGHPDPNRPWEGWR